MKDSNKILIILLIIAIAISPLLKVRNDLMALREEVNLQKAQVETYLQRRCDLIPNLVKTVKWYANHEENVFKEIEEARAKLVESIESGSIEKIVEANNSLDTALGKLLEISEDYPELTASQQFTALQDEIAGTENRITRSRQCYNEKVSEYNIAVNKFPDVIIARMCGYFPMQYFEAEASAYEHL